MASAFSVRQCPLHACLNMFKCITAFALLVAVATASPLRGYFYTDVPHTSFVSSVGDNLDYLRSAVYEKPIFVATKAAENDDQLTAALIDGGYHSLAVNPQYRLFRDHLMKGNKVVFLMKPTRDAAMPLPIKHLIVPQHYSALKSADFEDSIHSNPWVVSLDPSDVHSGLFSNLRRSQNAVDFTEDSARLLKTALVGYEPINRAGLIALPQSSYYDSLYRTGLEDYFMPAERAQYEPALFRSSPSLAHHVMPLRSHWESKYSPLQRAVAVPYVKALYHPLQRDDVVPYAFPQDSSALLAQPSVSPYGRLLLNSAAELNAKPSYYILLNGRDLSDARQITEDEAVRLLKFGKMSSNEDTKFDSKSLVQSENMMEGSSSKMASESLMSNAMKTGQSLFSSEGKTTSNTGESITKTSGQSSSNAFSKAGGLLETGLKVGANVVSTGAKVVASGAEEIAHSGSSSIKTSSMTSRHSSSADSSSSSSSGGSSSIDSSSSDGVLGSLLHKTVETGAGLVSKGASVIGNAADIVSATAERHTPLGIVL